MAVIAKPIEEIATLARLKLRSRNSDSGTSGSRRFLASQTMKTASTSRPPTISAGTVITPVIVPQSYWWPSWMPKTSRNMPTPESATPSQSNEWVCVGRRGTSRHASTKPTTPTGTLMKKIHSQPERVDEHTAQDRPDQGGHARRRTPQGHRLAAALGGEDPRDDRHRLRRHHRGAEALEDAGDDQHLDRPGQAAPQRGQREDGQADQVEVLGPEPVTEPPGDEHRHRVGEQVGAGHPDDGVHVGVQVRDDRGGRHGDDRGVDEDHEEPDAQGEERRPRVDLGGHVSGRLAARRGIGHEHTQHPGTDN